MKRLLLLFIPLVFFFGCEKDNPGASVAHSNTQSNINDNGNENSTSYNCVEIIDETGAFVNYECVAEAGGQYNTLEDCQNSQNNCVGGDCEICLILFSWEKGDYEPSAHEEIMMWNVMEIFGSMSFGFLCGDDLDDAKDAFSAIDNDDLGADSVADDPTTPQDDGYMGWSVWMACMVAEDMPAVPGCMWQEACNYSPEVTINDGSCVFPPEC